MLVLTALLMLLSAAPKVSGEASVSMKIDGKNEYAAGVHAIVPITSDHLAVSVDFTSRTILDAPTASGGVTLLSKQWALTLAMRSQADGTVQPCATARATMMRGENQVSAQVSVAPADAVDKVTGSVAWASAASPVAVRVSGSSAGTLTVGMSISSM